MGLLDSILDPFLGGRETTSEQTGTKKGTTTKYVDIDKAGLDKIVADVLGSEQGLAQLLSSEGASGLYSSTVSKQASGDLVTKLAGELAKLTAKDVVEEDLKTTGTGTETGPSHGIFDFISGASSAVSDIGGMFGGGAPAK